MYKYFNECKNQDEAKKLYKELARKHHPDVGGDLRTMQEINAEYARFQASGANSEARQRQREANAQGKKSAADYQDIDEVTEKVRVKIEFALNLDGVEVELMGLWVWLTGNTKAHKESLKADGWKWSPKKSAWYFAGVPTFNRQENTLDEIRETYGSQKFTRKQENAKALPA